MHMDHHVANGLEQWYCRTIPLQVCNNNTPHTWPRTKPVHKSRLNTWSIVEHGFLHIRFGKAPCKPQARTWNNAIHAEKQEQKHQVSKHYSKSCNTIEQVHKITNRLNETEKLKKALVGSFYGTDRGLKATSETRTEIVELITQLEAKNPTPASNDVLTLLNGKWILGIYQVISEYLLWC